MQSILIIHMYFGKLPDFFRLWLKSCEDNPSIDFLICTDQLVSSNKSNIKIYNTTLAEIKHRAEKIFDFEIALSSPRKLCDYKGLFGLIMHEYTSNYDFWGYCDSDLVFGDIRAFLTEEILKHYKFFLVMGHFHLQSTYDPQYLDIIKTAKGRGEIAYWQKGFDANKFRLDIGKSYKDIFSTDQNYNFDEWPYGIPAQYYKMHPDEVWSGFNEYGRCFDDVDARYNYMCDIFNNYKKYLNSTYYQLSDIFTFLKREKPYNPDLNAVIYKKYNNKLYRIGLNHKGVIKSQEILYAHFLHRPIKIQSTDLHNFLIIPDVVIKLKKITPFSLFCYNHRLDRIYNLIISKLKNKLNIK